MPRNGLECNIEEVFDKYCSLTQKEMNKAVRSALRAGARELQKTTKSNLSSSLKTRDNTHWYNGKIIFYNDKVEDAVLISKIDGSFDEELSQKVHIMGTRNSGSGTYRTRFLEKGTKERYAKHGRNREHELINLKKPRRLGSIKGKWFFKSAQNSVFPSLPTIYMNEINKAVDKINNTKI